MSKIKVLRVRVGQRPEVIEIDPGLSAMQEIVGGYIECLPIDFGIDLWLNEEGSFSLPVNFLIPAIAPTPPEGAVVIYADPDLARPGERSVHIIHGDVFFARHDDDGETVSLTAEDIFNLMSSFQGRA